MTEQWKSEFSEENTEAIDSSLLCLEVSSIYSFSVNSAFYIKGRPKSTHQNFKNCGDLDQGETHLASNKYTDFYY